MLSQLSLDDSPDDGVTIPTFDMSNLDDVDSNDAGGGSGTTAAAARQVSVSSTGGHGSSTTTTTTTTAKTPTLTGRPPIRMSLMCDPQTFNQLQVSIRSQVEFFEAYPQDILTVQGRNKPVQVGQVGIRCMHCRLLPVSDRYRGSMYYPTTLPGIYQAAQNMASHLQECPEVPIVVREELKSLALDPNQRKSSAGKEEWAQRAAKLGVFEDENGLRFTATLMLGVHGHRAAVAEKKAQQEQGDEVMEVMDD